MQRRPLKSGTSLREMTRRQIALVSEERHHITRRPAALVDISTARAALSAFPDLRAARSLSCLEDGVDTLWAADPSKLLLEILSHPAHASLFDALWLITNLSTTTNEQYRTALQPLVSYVSSFLGHASPLIAEQAAWALGNMALVLGPAVALVGAEHLLPRLLSSHPRTAAWALTNLLLQTRRASLIIPQLEPALALLTTCEDEDTLTEVLWLWAIVCMAAEPEELQAVLPSLLPALLPIEQRGCYLHGTPVARILGVAPLTSAAGLAAHVPFLLSRLSGDYHAPREALYVFCNLAAAGVVVGPAVTTALSLGPELASLSSVLLWNSLLHLPADEPPSFDPSAAVSLLSTEDSQALALVLSSFLEAGRRGWMPDASLLAAVAPFHGHPESRIASLAAQVLSAGSG